MPMSQDESKEVTQQTTPQHDKEAPITDEFQFCFSQKDCHHIGICF
jgi:hypothetical protein